MTERPRVREIDDDEGRRLVRIVRRDSGSVVTWRRAQLVPLPAQGWTWPRSRGWRSPARTGSAKCPQLQRRWVQLPVPKYKGGRPPKFSRGQRREIKKIAKSSPAEHGLPFSTWNREFLVAEGVVDDISHEGLRVLLREEGVTFQQALPEAAPVP